LTKVLVEKLTNMDMQGQQQMTTCFQQLDIERNQLEVDAEMKVSESVSSTTFYKHETTESIFYFWVETDGSINVSCFIKLV